MKKNIHVMHAKQGFSFEQCNDKLSDDDATNCARASGIVTLCIAVDVQ